jgi:hypothetical protein
MENFKFFSNQNSTISTTIENGLIFQYQLNDTYKQYEIESYTLLNSRTFDGAREYNKLKIDTDCGYDTYTTIINDVKDIKVIGLLYRVTDGRIISKTEFQGVLSSSNWSTNSDECTLEFYLDYYRNFNN